MVDATVTFLENITGLGDGEKLELRLIDKSMNVTSYFFKKASKAVRFAEKRRRDHHIYFGVGPRKATSSRGRKEDVSSVSSVWIDLDRKGRTRMSTLRKRLTSFPLHPSYVVFTGGGLHAYWRLSERVEGETVEPLLRSMQTFFHSDHVIDSSRVLRLPDTLNHKYSPPREVKIEKAQPELVYDYQLLKVLSSTPQDVVELITTGAHDKYKSRSERDFAVMSELIRRGANLDLIEHIFRRFAVGDRYDESGLEYLERTFESASEFIGAVEEAVEDTGDQPEFVEFQDCYFVGDKRVSTFVLEPTGILEEMREDSLVCHVRSRGYSWRDRVFPRSAFTRADALQRHLPILSWQWLGTDKQVRSLLVQLVDQLLVDGEVPKVKATSVIGRHDEIWVTPKRSISVNGVVPDDLKYVNVGRERPLVDCKIVEDDDEYRELLKKLLNLLPQINRPEVVYPVMSWFLATPQKPVLEARGIRFPILMLFGTRGSGKTSLIQDVFQPLVGYLEPRSYDCSTTKFSTLALLGSTNAVPVSFKEYRGATREGEYVQRMLRLAYDVGYDLRGRPDQTTESYSLTAPITIDGEDLLHDPANLERLVAVNLQPEHIYPGSVHYEAFQEITKLPLTSFVGRYIQFCLASDEAMLRGWPNYLDRAQSMTRPLVLPARIASNYAVLFYGLRVFQQFLNQHELQLPSETDFFKESLTYVFDALTGRTRLLVDDFVSDIINDVAIEGGRHFAWRYEEEEDLLWIHLKSSHNWWLSERRRRNEETLGAAALKQQMKERSGTGPGQYIGEPYTKSVGRQAFWMYPIDVRATSEALDTPYPLSTSQVIIKTKGDDDE